MIKEELVKFFKFGFVGVLNTLVDNVVFNLLLYMTGVGRTVAKIVAYCLATVHSYLWNSRWTFKDAARDHKKQILKFIVVNLISLGAGILALNAAVPILTGLLLRFMESMHHPDLVRYSESIANLIVAGPISILVNFGGTRLWVFRGKKQEDKK